MLLCIHQASAISLLLQHSAEFLRGTHSSLQMYTYVHFKSLICSRPLDVVHGTRQVRHFRWII